jgi:hypothetical protein
MEESNMDHLYAHFFELQEFMAKQKHNEFDRAQIEYKEFVKGKEQLKNDFGVQLLAGIKNNRNSLFHP